MVSKNKDQTDIRRHFLNKNTDYKWKMKYSKVLEPPRTSSKDVAPHLEIL